MGMLSCIYRTMSPRMFLSLRRVALMFAATLMLMIFLIVDETPRRELLRKNSPGIVLSRENYFSTPSGLSARPPPVFTDGLTRVPTGGNTDAVCSNSGSSASTGTEVTTVRYRPEASTSRGIPDTVRHVGKAAVTDGIFWSDRIEKQIPAGLDPQGAMETVRRTRGRMQVVALDQPTSVRCGKTPNAVVTLADNRTFCAKYSQSSNHFVLGELLSFHLSHLLGMDNVPPVLLSYVNVTSQSPWNDVIDVMRSLFWSPGIIVALISWIPGIQHKESKVTMPLLVSRALKTGNPLTSETVRHHFNCTCGVYDVTCTCLRDIEQELSRVAQWGTMTIFDYVTANYDRVLNSLPQPGPPIRNLRQSSRGKFWLLDNEAGFFRSYQLIHRGTPAGRRLQHAHLRHLRSTCIFQRFFERRLSEFVKPGGSDPAQTLMEYARMREPLLDRVPVDSTAMRTLREMFSRRVFEVLSWIAHCRSVLSKGT